MPAQPIALLGDSIFDNAGYTAGAPDVITHLHAVLPSECRASLIALDGSTDKVVKRAEVIYRDRPPPCGGTHMVSGRHRLETWRHRGAAVIQRQMPSAADCEWYAACGTGRHDGKKILGKGEPASVAPRSRGDARRNGAAERDLWRGGGRVRGRER